MHGLGRLYSPDERDKLYPLSEVLPEKSTRTRRFWYAYGTYLDQGQTPQCVAYSLSHFLTDSPITHSLAKLPLTPQQLYDQAQLNDEWPGQDYDGTSVRGGAKALINHGIIAEYRWAASIDDVILCVLEQGPVVVGTNWYYDMFEPVNGYLQVSGDLAGGHAWKIDGVNTEAQFFRMKNSWGKSWGNSGFARLHFSDFERLFSEDGEAVLALELI